MTTSTPSHRRRTPWIIGSVVLVGVFVTATVHWEGTRKLANQILQALGLQSEKGFEEALRDANKAIRLDPTDPKNYVMRGQLNSSLGNYSEALRDFEAAIKLSPEHIRSDEAREKILELQKALEEKPYGKR